MQGDASDDEEGEGISCGLLVISNHENRSWPKRGDVQGSMCTTGQFRDSAEKWPRIERRRGGERGYRTMTILRALVWSQPTQGNTCSRLAGYDRCHWLAKLPPGLHTLRLRRSCSPFLSPFLSLFSNVINFRNDVEERERIFRK